MEELLHGMEAAHWTGEMGEEAGKVSWPEEEGIIPELLLNQQVEELTGPIKVIMSCQETFWWIKVRKFWAGICQVGAECDLM